MSLENLSDLPSELLAKATGPDSEGFDMTKLNLDNLKESVWELIKQADCKLKEIIDANSS